MSQELEDRDRPQEPDRWPIEQAESRLAELVRRAASRPQHIFVGGAEAAVVLSAEEFERLKGEPTGQVLLDIMARCPHDFEIERIDIPALPRKIDL